MIGKGKLDALDAYKLAVDGFRMYGWKDLGLDQNKRGINSFFESDTEKWEVLIGFFSDSEFEIRCRSIWKLNKDSKTFGEKLIQKVNASEPRFDFILNNNGSFEVKTTNQIPHEDGFMDLIRASVIDNIDAYESYSSLFRNLPNETKFKSNYQELNYVEELTPTSSLK
jgi:hypothetical protein